MNEKSSILWHKRLDHISRQGIEKLIKDEILPNLDFSNFYTCLDCIKDKLTTKVRNSNLGLFIQIFVGHSLILQWVATNISSHSLMIILVMVLSSSFMRSLTL